MVPQEWDAGAKVVDLVRKHGVMERTMHHWKKKYDGLEASEARRNTPLQHEHRRLKQLVDDEALNLQVEGTAGKTW